MEKELSNKQKEILDMIKENPEGIFLAEIAYKMDVAFISLTEDIRKLLEDNLVTQEKNKYFISKQP